MEHGDQRQPGGSRASDHARRRRVVVLAGASLVITAVVGALAFTGRPSEPGSPVTSQPVSIATSTSEAIATTAAPSIATTTSTTSTTSTTTSAPAGGTLRPWTIASDPTWHRADSDLLPNLGWDSLTLATFPIRPGGENCAHLPEQALRDLDDGDVLISVFFVDGISVFLSDSIVGPRPWPNGGFDDEAFPAATGPTDAHECAGRPGLEVHWDAWRNGTADIYVLVAFGAEAGTETRATTWATLSSLAPADDGEASRACVVTVPNQPGFMPPAPYPASPSPPEMEWFGTSALWVPLPVDGSFVPTKSVWWSEDFDISAGEERPDISVRHERLDAIAPAVLSAGPGTNANTSEDGWFMISDIEILEAPGCWRVTAEYREATLSYVVLVP